MLAPVLALWTLLGLRAFPFAKRARGLAAFLLASRWCSRRWCCATPRRRRARADHRAGRSELLHRQRPPRERDLRPARARARRPVLRTRRRDRARGGGATVARSRPGRSRATGSRQSFQHIRTHTGQWLGLLVRKLRLLVNWYELPDAEDQYFFERESNVLRRLGRLLHFGVLLPLAAAGALLESARRRQLAVLYVVLATTAAGLLVFYLMARYRYPLVPGLALLAGAALVAGFERARDGRWRELLPAGAVALALVPICNHTLFARDFQLRAVTPQSGRRAGSLKRPAEAALEYREALRLQPGGGDLAGSSGGAPQPARLDEALAAFEQAKQLEPESWRPVWQIGPSGSRSGSSSARAACSRAPPRWTGPAPSRSERSRRRARTPDTTARRCSLAQRARARPRRSQAPMQLAFLLATCPDPALRNGAEALALAQQVARARPDDVGALDVLAAAQAEQGHWDEALATIRRALAIAEQSGSPSWRCCASASGATPAEALSAGALSALGRLAPALLGARPLRETADALRTAPAVESRRQDPEVAISLRHDPGDAAGLAASRFRSPLSTRLIGPWNQRSSIFGYATKTRMREPRAVQNSRPPRSRPRRARHSPRTARGGIRTPRPGTARRRSSGARGERPCNRGRRQDAGQQREAAEADQPARPPVSWGSISRRSSRALAAAVPSHRSRISITPIPTPSTSTKPSSPIRWVECLAFASPVKNR